MRLAVDNDGLDFGGVPFAERIAREQADLAQKAKVVPLRPMGAAPFVWRPPAEIPPRPWLVGIRALLGFATAIVAPGGLGKTTYAMGLALSVATGRALMAERVWQAGPVWIWNLEDGRDELERRVTAAILHFDLDPAAMPHPIFLNSGRDRPLCMAAATVERGEDGATVTHLVHPDEAPLIAEAKANAVRMIVVDPFVSSHTLNENSNPDMAAAMAAWARVAEQAGCAVILVHHTRKGALGGNIEDARGGSAIANAARVGLTLSRMDDAAGERFDVPERDRWRYVRIDDAKANLSPRADKATWIRLASVELGNSTDLYPNGDSVQVAEPWTPPDVFDDITKDQANAALDRIAEGPKEGQLYGLSRRGRANDRWAGTVLMDEFDLNETQAKHILAIWQRNGVLVEVEYHDREEGRSRKGVRVEASKRPA